MTPTAPVSEARQAHFDTKMFDLFYRCSLPSVWAWHPWRVGHLADNCVPHVPAKVSHLGLEHAVKGHQIDSGATKLKWWAVMNNHVNGCARAFLTTTSWSVTPCQLHPILLYSMNTRNSLFTAQNLAVLIRSISIRHSLILRCIATGKTPMISHPENIGNGS